MWGEGGSMAEETGGGDRGEGGGRGDTHSTGRQRKFQEKRQLILIQTYFIIHV